MWKLLAAIGLLITGITVTTVSKARGIRNNNPGNIRYSAGTEWIGQTGQDPAGFVVFDTPEHGIRAITKVLRTYYYTHGITTISGMIYRYAPPSENDTLAYVQDIARHGIATGVPMTSETFERVLPELIQAIINHENGSQPYTVAQINNGISLA